MEFDELTKQRENGSDETNSNFIYNLLLRVLTILNYISRLGGFHRRRKLRQVLRLARMLFQVH
jgi:hypothetical protein